MHHIGERSISLGCKRNEGGEFTPPSAYLTQSLGFSGADLRTRTGDLRITKRQRTQVSTPFFAWLGGSIVPLRTPKLSTIQVRWGMCWALRRSPDQTTVYMRLPGRNVVLSCHRRAGRTCTSQDQLSCVWSRPARSGCFRRAIGRPRCSALLEAVEVKVVVARSGSKVRPVVIGGGNLALVSVD